MNHRSLSVARTISVKISEVALSPALSASSMASRLALARAERRSTKAHVIFALHRVEIVLRDRCGPGYDAGGAVGPLRPTGRHVPRSGQLEALHVPVRMVELGFHIDGVSQARVRKIDEFGFGVVRKIAPLEKRTFASVFVGINSPELSAWQVFPGAPNSKTTEHCRHSSD